MQKLLSMSVMVSVPTLVCMTAHFRLSTMVHMSAIIRMSALIRVSTLFGVPALLRVLKLLSMPGLFSVSALFNLSALSGVMTLLRLPDMLHMHNHISNVQTSSYKLIFFRTWVAGGVLFFNDGRRSRVNKPVTLKRARGCYSKCRSCRNLRHSWLHGALTGVRVPVQVGHFSFQGHCVPKGLHERDLLLGVYGSISVQIVLRHDGNLSGDDGQSGIPGPVASLSHIMARNALRASAVHS